MRVLSKPECTTLVARLSLLLVTILLPVGAYGLTLVHGQKNASQSRPTTVISVRATPHGSAVVRASQPTVRLSDSKYRSMRDRLSALVKRRGPRAALNWLGAAMNRDPAVLRSCHALVHEIGHAAYWKYRDFARALKYEDDLCGSGYMHGVVEARLGTASDVYAELARICTAYAMTNLAGKCYHGVGHGLMSFTHNDVPFSLRLCSNFGALIDKIRCSEGVFMENFSTDQKVHPSSYLDPTHPLYPCPQQSEFYKGSCYFYAPIYYLSLHYEDYRGSLRSCTAAESRYVVSCITGVGSRIEKQNISKPQFVERTCASAEGSMVDACIDGMISYFLVNFNSARKAVLLCQNMQPAHRRACYRGVESRRAIFGA